MAKTLMTERRCKHCQRLSTRRENICTPCHSILEAERRWIERGSPRKEIRLQDFKKIRLQEPLTTDN